MEREVGSRKSEPKFHGFASADFSPPTPHSPLPLPVLLLHSSLQDPKTIPSFPTFKFQTPPPINILMRSISTMKSLLSHPSFHLASLSPPNTSPSLFPPPIPTLPYSNPALLKSIVALRPKPSPSASRSYAVSPDSSMESRSSSGEIHVILGPMFAGKTTALLRRIRSESDNGRRVAIIKSNKDTRYGLESVVTHDGAKMPCLALPELSMFRAKIGVEAYNKLDVIGIDEAQFFEDLHDFCCNAADRDGKAVIVAGLDGDYLRRKFGSVLDIIPLADSVTKLTARCELCGRRAFFTLRKTSETQTEVIGGADVYMPVCRQHYVNGQIVIEATRMVLESPLQCDSVC